MLIKGNHRTKYKSISRWYNTPAVLHKFYPELPPFCSICGENPVSILRVFWMCPNIQPSWEEDRCISQKLTDYLKLYFLATALIRLKTYCKSILRHMLNTAKTCIPAHQKDPNPPALSYWVLKMEEIFSSPPSIGENLTPPLGTIGVFSLTGGALSPPPLAANWSSRTKFNSNYITKPFPPYAQGRIS